jgi:Carbonic anhydrases/acetyltransferases, isoleucine patch superfamily
MLIISFGIATSFFIFGITQIIISGIVRIVFRLNLKEGEYHIISAGAFKWMFANSLYQLMTATFMDFILLTPLANVFHRLMGAKIGKNVQINSKFCADLSLLEVDDGSVIGGHATVISHSFERNKLILKKVKIGKKVVIGLNSVILPGCEIEDGALIAAGAVLGKNTHVGRHEVYCGVPAESAKARHAKEA